MQLPALAVKRPIATTMLLLSAVLLGLVSLSRLPLALLPELPTSERTIWIPYPDAGVMEVEEAVARPAEQAVVTVRGVRGVRSQVVTGGVSVTALLQPGTDPELAALNVRERLDAIRWTLPEGTGRPVLLGGSDLERPAMVLALAADDLVAAADWAETVLKPRLEQVEGVARAQILGKPKP